MDVEKILNLDLSKGKNKTKAQDLLLQIKPFAKQLAGNKEFTLEDMETFLHRLCIHYDYRTQWIFTVYKNDREETKQFGVEFLHYSVGVVDQKNGNQWFATIYAKTLWELTAKCILCIYADLKHGRKRKENKA